MDDSSLIKEPPGTATEKTCPNCLGKKIVQFAIFLQKPCPLCQGKGTVIHYRPPQSATTLLKKEPLK